MTEIKTKYSNSERKKVSISDTNLGFLTKSYAFECGLCTSPFLTAYGHAICPSEIEHCLITQLSENPTQPTCPNTRPVQYSDIYCNLDYSSLFSDYLFKSRGILPSGAKRHQSFDSLPSTRRSHRSSTRGHVHPAISGPELPPL